MGGGGGQAKASFTLPALGPATPCVCVDGASLFSSFTSPRCHGVKGRGMLPHGSPNPPVSSNICIPAFPSTRSWQVLHQHLLPEVWPTQASPSSDDRAGRQSSLLPSPPASSQLGVSGSSTFAGRQALNRPGGGGGPGSASPQTSSLPSPIRATPALVTSSTTWVICLGEPPYLQQTQEGLGHNICHTATETC